MQLYTINESVYYVFFHPLSVSIVFIISFFFADAVGGALGDALAGAFSGLGGNDNYDFDVDFK